MPAVSKRRRTIRGHRGFTSTTAASVGRSGALLHLHMRSAYTLFAALLKPIAAIAWKVKCLSRPYFRSACQHQQRGTSESEIAQTSFQTTPWELSWIPPRSPACPISMTSSSPGVVATSGTSMSQNAEWMVSIQ